MYSSIERPSKFAIVSVPPNSIPQAVAVPVGDVEAGIVVVEDVSVSLPTNILEAIIREPRPSASCSTIESVYCCKVL